jgi:hypothetical protein
MKDYPYIKIILIEFWEKKREFLIENDIINITAVHRSNYDNILGVNFIKEDWNMERMLDLPVSYYEKRLKHYKSVERELKLKELGI